MRNLSDAVGGIVSHNAISKYERGMMMPDAKVLNALSKALDVTYDYFLRPESVEISQIEFRKKSSLSKKQTNSIKEIIKDNIERYIQLERFLDLHKSFENPINDILVSSAGDIERQWNDCL